jgi:hypothetical protein
MRFASREDERTFASCVRAICGRRGPFEQSDEIGIDGDARSDRTRKDCARVAVDREDVAFLVHDVAAAQGRSVELNSYDAADGRHAPGTRDDRGMAHHSAKGRQNALGDAHAVDVLGRGLATHEKHVFAGLGEFDRPVGIKDNLAGGGAGRNADAGGDRRAVRRRASYGSRSRKEFGVDAGCSLGGLKADPALADEVHRNPRRRERAALADACLQEPETAAFDCELDVAHVR